MIAWLLLPILLAAPATDPVPAETGPKITLRWVARQEESTYGYLVYRSEQRAGPFRRVNGPIVRKLETPGPSHEYRWEDRTVEAGHVYYYYIESIDRRAKKSRLSGVVSKTVEPVAPPPAPPDGGDAPRDPPSEPGTRR